jgi:hypothetical protein
MRRLILVSVIERAIRAVAIVTSAIIVLSFAMFAIDQFRASSKHEQDKLADTNAVNPTEAQKRAREKAHGDVREKIDEADDFLLSPFTDIVDANGHQWVQRSVPTAFGLLVYGFGLGFLARFMRGRA